jgi:RNA polymerase sigma-70 factor (ECF subfamily)
MPPARAAQHPVHPLEPRTTAVDPRFERLVADFAPKVYALALRTCGSHAQAEEAVQDTFLQATRSWPRFRRDSKPSTWLYTIALRACRRRRRTASRRTVPALSSLMPFTDTSVADLRSGVPTPDELQEHAETRAALERAVLRLPEAFRLAVVLKDILELPTPDVARVLGVQEKTVKTRVHRARLMLREAIIKGVPQREAPRPSYQRQVCADLLRAKLEAMDHGRRFPMSQEVMCERCRSVFAELDLTQNACAALAAEHAPASVLLRLRELVLTPADA